LLGELTHLLNNIQQEFILSKEAAIFLILSSIVAMVAQIIAIIEVNV